MISLLLLTLLATPSFCLGDVLYEDDDAILELGPTVPVQTEPPTTFENTSKAELFSASKAYVHEVTELLKSDICFKDILKIMINTTVDQHAALDEQHARCGGHPANARNPNFELSIFRLRHNLVYKFFGGHRQSGTAYFNHLTEKLCIAGESFEDQLIHNVIHQFGDKVQQADKDLQEA